MSLAVDTMVVQETSDAEVSFKMINDFERAQTVKL